MSTAVMFTGWEPHEFIRLSRLLADNRIVPKINIFGREPITTTEVSISGTVIETIWDKYDRGVIVRSNDGRRYKVGGTNTTSSIASQVVLFSQIPENFFGRIILKSELLELLNSPEQIAVGGSTLT